jgi:hypothetical protein
MHRTFQRAHEDTSASLPRRLETRAGAVVSIVEREGEERIEVRDAREKLLIEIDPATGRATVTVPGDLCFAAPNGDIDLTAGGAVRLRGKKLELEAVEGRVGIRDLHVGGVTLQARLDQAKLEVGRLETVADRVFERARSVFRQAEDLYQLKAGRLRELVKGGYAVRAGHASLVADDEVKIDGKQINLG